MLLALDTATEAVTVAVHDGSALLAESTVVGRMRQGELLAPGIRAVLAEGRVSPSELTLIAVGVGPGPYTGLRVGVVTARTMGAALDVPVVGLCTLDVIAAAVSNAGPFLVATDARRKEVYWAAYDADRRRTSGPDVDRPAAVATKLGVAGRGAALYPESFPVALEPEYPRASDLAEIVVSREARLLDPEPLYLRRPDAAEPAARKRVL